MNNKTITSQSAVSLHFVLKLADDSVAESTYHQQTPAKFVMGDGSLTPGIENALLGLQVGDKKSFMVSPQDGFGETNPAQIYTLPRQQFPADLTLEPGLIISFTQPNQVEVPGIIRSIEGDLVIVDFNHPLAGQSLKFEVEILGIE